jgi:hypothetical protein
MTFIPGYSASTRDIPASFYQRTVVHAPEAKNSGVAGVQELQNETAAFRGVDGD